MTLGETGTYSKDHLEILYKASQAFSSSLNVDEVLVRIMHKVVEVTSAERGFIMLDRGDKTLEFKVAIGIDNEEIQNPSFEVSRSIVGLVASKGKPLLTTDAQNDAFLGNQTSVQYLKLRSVICSPLTVKGKIIGTIYADNRLKNGIFNQADLELLTAIASSAAIAIENAKLFQEMKEKGRMERELEQASQVQSGLMPSSEPELEGWQIAGKWIPAREVAGDFFDFIPLGHGTKGIVIGDVVDKGMAAALFMSYSRSLIRSKSIESTDLAKIIGEVNAEICQESTNGMFLTLVIAKVSEKNNSVDYVNAGHNPPVHFAAESKEISYLMPSGMLVGIDGDASYQTDSISLKFNDLIVFYTDGVIDALSKEGIEFGQGRFESLIEKHFSKTAPDIATEIWKSLEEFMGNTAHFDDITFVIVKKV